MSCGWNDPERSCCQRTPACNKIVLCCSLKFYLTSKMFFHTPPDLAFCRISCSKNSDLPAGYHVVYSEIKRLKRQKKIFLFSLIFKKRRNIRETAFNLNKICYLKLWNMAEKETYFEWPMHEWYTATYTLLQKCTQNWNQSSTWKMQEKIVRICSFALHKVQMLAYPANQLTNSTVT